MDLRPYLEEHLPAYAIPSAIVAVDAFPVTPNGKVDRAALPAPGSGRPDGGATYVAPQTDTERVITALWQEVLGVQILVSTISSIWEAIRCWLCCCTTGLKKKVWKSISIVDLFRYPTIAALAKLA